MSPDSAARHVLPAHGTLRGRPDEAPILRQYAAREAWLGPGPARPARGEHLVVNIHVEPAVRDVEDDLVAVLDEGDRPAVDSFGCDVADAQPGRTARESTVGKHQDVLAEAGALDRAGD